MTLVCRDKCRFLTSFLNDSGGYKGDDKKRCQICCRYCRTEERNCPCCSSLLRTKGRNNRSRRKRVNGYKRID